MLTEKNDRSVFAAAWRFARVAKHAVYGVWLCVWCFPRWSEERRQACVGQWSRQLLSILGARLTVQGDPLRTDGVLRVVNHVSWLDIVVLNACGTSHFISKAEVQRWPLVGKLATASGTLYLERGSRRDALRMSDVAATTLEMGECVTLFPEGTTSDGVGLLPFHPSLLQSAIDARAPVQPVVLRYHQGGSMQACRAAAYTGGDTLVASVWRVLRMTDLNVSATVLVPIDTQPSDERRALAQTVERQMRAVFQAHAAQGSRKGLLAGPEKASVAVATDACMNDVKQADGPDSVHGRPKSSV